VGAGKVKWFNEKKGFGFIIPDDAARMYLCIIPNRYEGFRTLKEGQAVEYDLGQGKKGPEATNVRPVA